MTPKQNGRGQRLMVLLPYVEEALTTVFGTECWDDSVKDTAARWLNSMKEFAPEDELPFTFTTFPTTVNQLVTVSDIKFSSLCAHHLFPFFGVAHVGYVPNKRQVGLSKIPRIVHHFATRPCSQEDLTARIAHFLKTELQAMGVAVVIDAQHTCMSARGVREHDGHMRTSEMRGIFLTSAEAREEFLALIRMNKL